MGTSLRNCEIQLSKDMIDYWASTTTGAGSTTALVDSSLAQHGAGWLTKRAYAEVVEGTYDGVERKASALVPSTGTITTLAFAGAPGTGIDYRVHRIFSAADKKLALIESCKDIFPVLHERIRDENHRAGNWLKNGSMSRWTASTIPDSWVKSAVTAAENTTAPYYIVGTNSCKLDTAAGYIYQSVTQNPNMWELAGHTVTFKIRGWCDTASALRIAIYDGTDTTYSDYHDGDSAWDQRGQGTLSVTATIAADATDIAFRIYLASASATAYVDDARVLGPQNNRVYVGGLLIAKNEPFNVYQSHENYAYHEPWERLRGDIYVDEDGWMSLPNAESDYRLRIEGRGYLDFLASGVSSTLWTAEINIDDPQVKVLSAKAQQWLYTNLIMPNMTTGTEEAYYKGLAYVNRRLADRTAKLGMYQMPAVSNFGAR